MSTPNPLAFAPVPLKFPEAVGVAPPAKVLDYAPVHQEQTNWCWAAVTLAVANYFEPTNDWTQCRIVNGALERGDCDEAGGSSACNRPYYIYESLALVGHYADRKASGKQAFDAVKAEIEDDRPLCVLVKWNGGGGHFVGVYGYDDAGEMLHVGDPWYGDSLVPHGAFPATYQSGASWGWSYWTT